MKPGQKPALPTVAAALDYATRLCADAAALTNPDSPVHDPYARPYAPTDAAVYKLCQRCAKQAVAEVERVAVAEDREPTVQEIDEARAMGPSRAMDEMRYKAGARDRERKRDKEEADHRDRRHQNRQAKAARDREAARRGLTLGARLDRALAALSTVGSVRSSVLQEPVAGDKESLRVGPAFQGDPSAQARQIATEAVRKVEDELETARRRRVETRRDAA